MLVYLNGRFLESSEAAISAFDRGFIFGDGVYEVWRVVRGQLFEAARHQQRLERGLRELRITRPVDGTLERITAIGERLLKDNGLASGEATLYVEITRGSALRTHYFPLPGTAPTMFAMASAFAPSETRFSGTKVITQPDVRWLRCADTGESPVHRKSVGGAGGLYRLRSRHCCDAERLEHDRQRLRRLVIGWTLPG